MDDVAAFRALLAPEGQGLLASLPPYDEGSGLREGRRARRAGHDPALVAAALTQSRLRQRARGKLGAADADRLYFTPDGLEQATRPAVAARRARRYAEAGVTRVADLCCGIGADLAALLAEVPRAVAVDRDPLTCAVAEANMAVLGLADRAEIRCADATETDLRGVDGAFVDPARRGGGRRRFRPEGFSPAFSFVPDLAGQVPATAAKLAPGIPHDVLPSTAEAEWVSVAGDVVECTLWFGPLSTGVRRRATVLPAAATLAGDGSTMASVARVGRYLYEPDGAVIRAGLVADLAAHVDGSLVDPTIAYVTADRLVPTPFATAYEVTDVVPFQLKRLRALLRERHVGRLTVKKRGSAIEPEGLRRAMHLTGTEAATIVLTRVAGRQMVMLVEPRS